MVAAMWSPPQESSCTDRFGAFCDMYRSVRQSQLPFCRQQFASLLFDSFKNRAGLIKEYCSQREQIVFFKGSPVEKECKYLHVTVISLEGVSIPLVLTDLKYFCYNFSEKIRFIYSREFTLNIKPYFL